MTTLDYYGAALPLCAVIMANEQSPLVGAHGPFRERQPGAGGGLLSDLGRGDRDRRERWLLRLCM